MSKQQEFREQTEEAKLEAFSLMCRKVADLEKENAELKEKVNILDNCDRLGDVITEAYKDQLTKAKEIIKNLLSAYTTYADSFDDRDNEIVEEAGQFISEVEK